MVQVDKETLIEEAKGLGIETDGLTVAALKKAIHDKKLEPQANDATRSEETPEARAERKTAEKKGPIAKPKKSQSKPHISNLYPWAVNRRKAETAHIAVHEEIRREIADGRQNPTDEETEQRIMDHYTLHGGLVRGQEKVTTVGRRKPIKAGQTTDDVVHENSAGDDADDLEDDDE